MTLPRNLPQWDEDALYALLFEAISHPTCIQIIKLLKSKL